MKKLLKILAVLAIIVVVLMVAALVTLKIMFPPEKLKALAQNYAQQALNREVSFSDVSFNLIGLTLEDFAVSERGTFANGTFVKADELVAKVALKPLFSKRVEIGSLGLDGVEIHVSQDKEGKFNFDDLLPYETEENIAEETQESDTAPLPFSLTAERIYLTNSSLYYSDAQSGMTAEITDLDFEVRHFDLNDPFDVTVAFTTSYQDGQGMDVTVPVKAEATAALAGGDMSLSQATLKKLEVTYKNIVLTLYGTVQNFLHPVADLQGKLSGISDASLAEFVPDLPTFVLPDILISASAEADLDASSAQIKLAKFSIADTAATVRGTAGWGGETPTYTLKADLTADLAQLAASVPMLAPFGLRGHMTGALTATEKKDFQDISGQLQLKDIALKYDPVTLSALNGTVRIVSLENISGDNLTGQLNDGHFTTSFAYKDLNGIMDLLFNFDLDKLTLDTLPQMDDSTDDAAVAPSGNTASAEPELLFNVRSAINVGTITVPHFTTQGFSLNTDLSRASISMAQANGKVSFELKSGAVTDLEEFVKGNRIVKILSLPLTVIKTVSTKLGLNIFPEKKENTKAEIPFSSGSGTYQFTNGVMNVEETHFSSSVSNIKASGGINFQTQALDMKVSATLLTSQTPIVFKIGGTMDNPSGKLDAAGTAKSVIGGILSPSTPAAAAAGAAKAAEETVKAAGEVVKNTADTAKDAVNEAIKGIGSLLKKKSE